MSKAPTLRLDRLLANLGYGSRREMQALAKNGRITLDGAPVRDADQKVAITRDLPDHLQIDGKAIDPPPGIALMLHKPLGVTCSHKEAGPLVYDLLPTRWRMRDPAISTIGLSYVSPITHQYNFLYGWISDHSFHEPKYIRTSENPACLRARKVFDALAPLKQYR